MIDPKAVANRIKDKAIRNLYPAAVTTRNVNEADCKVLDINNNLIVIDDTLVQNEVDRLQAEYDALDYQKKRKEEYPKIHDLIVALYDDDDKAAIDAKRAEVKAKYPKP